MTENKVYTAAVLVIGNEILSGRTLDKNTQYIAQKMVERGVRLVEARVIPDIRDKIIETLNTLRAQVDYVFTTGGIGPTHDDITAECVAAAFDVELEKNPEAFEVLKKNYTEGEFTPARQKMAMIPAGATLIPNPVSAAPGFIIGNVHVMAGVPKIMQAMMDHIAHGLAGGDVMLSETVTFDMPESEMAGTLAELQEKYPDVEIGSYPNYRDGKPSLNVVLRSTDAERLAAVTGELRELGGPGET